MTTNTRIMCSFYLNQLNDLADTVMQIQGDIIKPFPRNSAWVDTIAWQVPDYVASAFQGQLTKLGHFYVFGYRHEPHSVGAHSFVVMAVYSNVKRL